MSNKTNNWEYLIDLVNILSFAIGLQNLDMNDQQIEDLQEHLNKQDEQYEKILNKLDQILTKGDK